MSASRRRADIAREGRFGARRRWRDFRNFGKAEIASTSYSVKIVSKRAVLRPFLTTEAEFWLAALVGHSPTNSRAAPILTGRDSTGSCLWGFKFQTVSIVWALKLMRRAL